jgi:hypothetical protein
MYYYLLFSDKLQRKLLDDEPLYDSVASDEEQQVWDLLCT